MLNIQQIQEILPHRYPFLMVDRIVELEPGKRAVGLKNVTINEAHFAGHFPGLPVMPGVLIVEALAQVAGIAAMQTEANKGKVGFLAGVDQMRFRRQVSPGDTLRLEVEITRMKGTIVRAKGVATVEDAVAAEGELMFAIGDRG